MLIRGKISWRSSVFLSEFLSVVLIFLMVVLQSLLARQANAGDLSWSGLYRVEAVKIKNAELTSDNNDKHYLLQHLLLSPKIVASDGITIYGRFDILNNPTFGVDNASGEFIGSSPNRNAPTPGTNGDNSNVLARHERAGDLAVTQLYVTWVQEFGVLVAGRTPLQFGLGTAYNAGNGMFDHYLTTEDMLGYKVILGNFFVMPMMGKTYQGNPGDEGDVNDYMLHVQYDNPETELSLGAFYQLRVAGIAGNDVPSGSNNLGGPGSTVVDGYKHQQISLYSSQKVHELTIAAEANLLTGEPGIRTTNGSLVKFNGYGLAGEVRWNPPEGKWFGNLKLGIASGDDPGTTDTYEGFAFNRNYDVAMLLFNHPLGQADFLRTGLVRNNSKNASSYIDTEALSNALYFAPSITNRWRDNFTWGATFVYALLNKDPIAGTSGSKSLGYELDLNITYKPFERLTWVNEAGFLMPGDGFKGGPAQSYENRFAYGLISKAAISF